MGYFASPQTPFSLLPKTRTPWTEFVFSTGTQACVVAFLVWVRMLHPEILSPPAHPYLSTQLVSAPAPVNHQPQPRAQLKPSLGCASRSARRMLFRLPAPQPKAAKLEEALAPTVSVTPQKLDRSPSNPAPVVPKVGSDECFFYRQFSHAHHHAPRIAGPDRRLRRSQRNSRQRHSRKSRQYRRSRILRSAIRRRIRQRQRWNQRRSRRGRKHRLRKWHGHQ